MSQELDARALMAACQGGDPAARRKAFAELGGFLARVASERLRSKPALQDQVEECAQEALLSIWRKLEAGGGPDRPERFLSWSASVVVHKVYDMLRRQGYSRPAAAAVESGIIPERLRRVPRAAQVSLERLLAGPDGESRSLRLPDPSALAPEAEAVDREAFAALVLTIRDHAKLSEHSKQVLAQGFLAEMDDDELARHLGTRRANVHVIRSRNLSKLREDGELLLRLRRHYDI